MATLGEYFKSWKKLSDNLEDVLVSQLHGESDKIEEFVREQLYSGKNGNEDNLRPKYSEDPYFQKIYGDNWKKHAINYRKYKKKITPPGRRAGSYLMFQPRGVDTPNLIIRGDFYSSITAIPIGGGLSVGSEGVSFSDDIEQKYTTAIYKIGDKAKKHYIRYFMLPQIDALVKDCGL